MIIVRLKTGHVIKIDNPDQLTAKDIYFKYNEGLLVNIYNYIFNVHEIAYIEEA